MATAPSVSTSPENPTRVRYGVLGFACALAMITYLDRVCFATAAGMFVTDLGLTSTGDLKWAFSAFALAYSLFEVPSGWLGDRFGPRNVLIRIVLWWSAFTAITGAIGMQWHGYTIGAVAVESFRFLGVTVPTVVVPAMVTLVIVRFLFGMGEAGAFPNITRALHNWFPLQERGFAQGAVWMAGRLGGGVTPIIWTVLIEGVHCNATTILPGLTSWRHAFWLFGVIGIIWCVAFAAWFRNRPEEKSTVNAAELELIRRGAVGRQEAHSGVPWRKMLASRNLWVVCLMYAFQSYGWYFYITYLPKYLEQQFDVDPSDLLGAVYKGGPLWLGAVGCLIGGILTDWFIRRTGNRRLGRKLFGAIGHALTAVCFLLCPLAPTAFWFFVIISLAGFCTDLAMGSAWAVCQDIGRRYAAIVAGFMNMVGNLGGTLASFMTGYILQLTLARHAATLGVAAEALPEAEKTIGLGYGYQINFLVFAAVYVLGFFCWLRIDSTQPVVPEEE